MIIELYGPPGAGKTTFANALERHLRQAGYTIEPVFSSRPAERDKRSYGRKPSRRGSSFLSRLIRPVMGMASVVRGTVAKHQASTWLIELNPPAKLIWRLRLSQYLMRL